MVFIVHRQPDLSAALPACRILKAADHAALLTAGDVVAAARAEAAAILRQAEDDAQAARAEGYREGHQEALVDAAESMIDNVQRTIEYYSSIEQTMVSLVITAVRKILSEFEDGERVARVVKKALAAVRNQKTIVVRVAPDQLDAVRGRVAEMLTAHPGIGFLDVVADARLGPDGCILESEIGTIDASVDVQITALHRAFTKQLGAVSG